MSSEKSLDQTEHSGGTSDLGPASEPSASLHKENQWQIVHVKARVDSSNQDQLADDIRASNLKGQLCIALDLRANRFLSFPAIRFCVEVARGLSERGGLFVLIGCPERTKRHFEIYGSLDHIRIVRSETDLSQLKILRDL